MIISQSLPEKYQAQFTDGTQQACTDAPSEYGGQNAGFKPVDLMEASLATCITTVIRLAADKRSIPLTGVKVTVNMSRDKTATETVFTYAIELAGELTEEDRATLLRAANGCPVKKALSRPVVFQAAE